MGCIVWGLIIGMTYWLRGIVSVNIYKFKKF